ncbi:MAG TPA: efflux RND transporter periplasmic adaptor subunit [Gemmatimonadales bacterium]|nr:efflux RND transporter periplasmic adaptor subunit [Gemmatimonadales bacterium]
MATSRSASRRSSLDSALALAAAALLAACGRSSTTLSVAGTVEIREVRLSPLSSGQLKRLLKDEGDSVHAGDTVAVLDQPGLDARIEQSRALADAAAQRTAEIRAAIADSTRTANDLARARALQPQGIASPQELDRAQSAAAAAAARLQSVRAAVRESQAARAAVQVTESIRDQLVLIAPSDGIVLTRFAERGEMIAAGVPVVSIGVVHAPWVRAYVGERFVARLKTGLTVSIHADGYSNASFAGHITEIAPRAEFTPRAALTERERADLVFGIKVAIDDTTGRLKAGMPVRVEIPLLP